MVSDHDLSKWIYKEHTKAKHELLRKYLGGWISILGSRHTSLLIFDGFAGRGEYDRGEPGSPLIILKVADELISKRRLEKVFCAFVEKDYDNFKNLQQVLDATKPQNPNVVVLGPYNSDFGYFSVSS